MIEPGGWDHLVELVLVSGGLVCMMMLADDSDEIEERYCPTCHKQTRWLPKKGCMECRWADQQW